MADLLSNQDVATKNYVDKNAITTAGGVAYDDLKFNDGDDLVRCLGCMILQRARSLDFLWGTKQIMCYHIPYSIHNYKFLSR